MIEENRYICERCGKEFKTSQGLGGHKKTFHSVGLDELDGVLEGETSPDEGLVDLKGYLDSLEQVRKKVESTEEYAIYKSLMFVIAIAITLIIILNKISNR